MLNKSLLLMGIPSYKIALTGGSATSDKESAMAGEVVTITTSPPAYRFTQVTINPSVNINDLGNNEYSFVMPSSDVTVNVTYNQSQAYSVRVNSSAGGSVSSSHSSARWGDVVTLTIHPNSGWGLSNISSSDVSFSGSGNARTFVMPNKAVDIQVSFKLSATHTVVAQKFSTLNGEGIGFAKGSGGTITPTTALNSEVNYLFSWVGGSQTELAFTNPFDITVKNIRITRADTGESLIASLRSFDFIAKNVNLFSVKDVGKPIEIRIEAA